ncbi:MerR family transcriptional regulator [Spirochaeta isovalerica]|uniref:DNA-binding transcriptional MerR regulator n=1 Tax=Spirochaeta isovalerica TaxID=150 RepID=A0A841R1S3_9SPIO|nr:MerR family transcriptional regulator [Spirochaeta isovalerica]MBB6478954.1 DNA-binding transcriptional MerR regulator [Spirochaeta isovalerica]
MYKVKEMAEMAGISVRTLHHYDRIGLLIPKKVGENGYRLYSEENISQLQQILFLRELDFSLETIKEMMADPSFGGVDALGRQRELLLKKRNRLDRIITALDETITARQEGKVMEKKKMFDAFDMKEIEEHQEKYAAEVKERWGNTDAYRESSRRTKKYGEKEWAAIKAESEDIYKTLVSLMDSDPDDKAVQDQIERWKQHMTKWFYQVNNEMLAGLGEMYVDDPRFTKNIDKYGEGLAVFIRDAIRVYCSK